MLYTVFVHKTWYCKVSNKKKQSNALPPYNLNSDLESQVKLNYIYFHPEKILIAAVIKCLFAPFVPFFIFS